MALTSSGQITLDEIHVEAGGTTQTLAAINDADIRALINATSASEIEFADFYGASGAGLEVQGTTKNNSSTSNYGASFTSSIPVNLTGQSIAVGDFVVIAVSSRTNMDGSWNWSTGMSLTTRTPTNETSFSNPGRMVATGVWASGNSNPYVTSVVDKNGGNIANVTIIFRNAGNLIQSAVADQISISGNATSIPATNLPSYSGSATTAGIITVLAAEQSDPESAANQTITAPSGYTLAGSHATLTLSAKGNYKGSYIAVAYKASTSNSAETIANWTVGSGHYPDAYTSLSMRVGA